MAVLHAETLWDYAELGKAQSFIKMQGMSIGGYNGIELDYAETKAGSYFQRVLH